MNLSNQYIEWLLSTQDKDLNGYELGIKKHIKTKQEKYKTWIEEKEKLNNNKNKEENK